ncbi:MAG: carbohydrate kinase family protein [Trueperaceae bacterium]|nr:MAG: carbohydrate kinase family protein [Trueperaceae bacterium]
MKHVEVVVAGHLCLDVIPDIPYRLSLEPGKLNSVGKAGFAPGGGLANVGLSLARLGVNVGLMGKLGRDGFGQVLMGLLTEIVPGAAETLKISDDQGTSYTLVISSPGVDRIFLHHPGCNDAFEVKDIDLELAGQGSIFYFGYPPLMRAFYLDGGIGLAERFEALRARGVTTVLDMALPDPESPAGKVDWRAFLARVLPHVDLFTPSLEEMLFMLEREVFDAGLWREHVAPGALEAGLATELLSMGPAAVVLTLGERGLYLRTAGHERLVETALASQHWARRELWAPIFVVDVEGTTGAGDAATAGLITGLLNDYPPERALTLAAAVGACCVEAADATSGIRSLADTLHRVEAGWVRAFDRSEVDNWRRLPSGAYRGPGDSGQPPVR